MSRDRLSESGLRAHPCTCMSFRFEDDATFIFRFHKKSRPHGAFSNRLYLSTRIRCIVLKTVAKKPLLSVDERVVLTALILTERGSAQSA